MRIRRLSMSGWLGATVLLFASLGVAQQSQDNQPTIKHTQMKPTKPSSGHDMFVTYCATCHGVDGKGDGPAASALKKTPADLTYLTKKYGGVFPETHAASVIRGEAGVSAHGSREMPIWGALFYQASGGQNSEVQQRVSNLVEYLKTIQVK